MNSHTNFALHFHATPNRRAPLGLFALILALAALLSISGCVGLTGASTPGSKSSSTSASEGTVSRGISPVAIAAGQNQSFQVQFAPKASGSVSRKHLHYQRCDEFCANGNLSGTGAAGLADHAAGKPERKNWVCRDVRHYRNRARTLTYQRRTARRSPARRQSHDFRYDERGQRLGVYSGRDRWRQQRDESAATLTVTASAPAPSITAQPASATVSAGQPATFGVTAAGTSRRSLINGLGVGAAISGATARSAYDSGGVFIG